MLARRLRGMRDDRGLTLREVAHKSGYSQASLSTAESGRRLPSWDLVQAFVQSCGEDPALWRQLWELAGDTAPAPAEGRRPGSPASGSPLIESPLNPSPVATPPVGAAPVGDRCPRP
ncbi:MAG TPA: helix-turn-helix transcriptional regulator, partial [Rugosimonospora sp.]|nr:helix-turn-helix transcriptional regulator [Rugosimonospora sp.]